MPTFFPTETSVPGDSESCSDDSTTSSNALGNDEGHAEPHPLSTIRGRFTGKALNFQLPCTATENTICQIVGHLSVWNEFLFRACWQLQEMPGTSGRLSLALFPHPTSIFWNSWNSKQLDRVILLVRHLLKTHRCVAHVEFDLLLLKVCDLTPLSEALQGRRSISRVKLTFQGSPFGEDLARAALCLPRLQELECSSFGCLSETLIDSLSSLLRNTSSLKMLRFSGCINFGGSSTKILQDLAQNRSSLTELVLPACLIAGAKEDAQKAFTWWLKKSVSLKSVTVLKEWTRLKRHPLNGILQGLLGNESITAVDIRLPILYQADVQLLSEIIRQNGKLQSLKISHGTSADKRPSFKEGGPNSDDSERCLEALVENSSLVEVALPIYVWNEHQWKKLFTALPGMTNLKRVSIELPDWTSSLADKLCAALRQTGAGEKVSFNAPLTVGTFDKRFECEAFSSVAVKASNADGEAMCEILERMPPLGHITCLELHFPFEVNLGTQLVSALATFLEATRTLKTLSLSFSSLDQWVDCQEALMDSLAVNRSLREVRIEVDKDSIDFSAFYKPLAAVINGSKNISRLHLTANDHFTEYYYDDDDYDKGDYDEDDYEKGIVENYTLLDLTVSECMFRLGRPWFKITDTTRRNQGLLTCAADFVTAARKDRRCAVALKRMQGHPELVEEVARLKGVDQERAAAMVQDKLRSIQWADMHQFMRLAGVVRERVSCRASEDGRTQLDALNEDCWRAIRRYLKLEDIRDATAESLPP
ncbi:uncharacterized protein LOC144138642 isoform X2 [Haemaphysalis longicornis]